MIKFFCLAVFVLAVQKIGVVHGGFGYVSSGAQFGVSRDGHFGAAAGLDKVPVVHVEVYQSAVNGRQLGEFVWG